MTLSIIFVSLLAVSAVSANEDVDNEVITSSVSDFSIESTDNDLIFEHEDENVVLESADNDLISEPENVNDVLESTDEDINSKIDEDAWYYDKIIWHSGDFDEFASFKFAQNLENPKNITLELSCNDEPLANVDLAILNDYDYKITKLTTDSDGIAVYNIPFNVEQFSYCVSFWYDENHMISCVDTGQTIVYLFELGTWTKNISFGSIQYAIDRANVGDTIVIVGKCIGRGSPITISKPLCLVGRDNAVLDANDLNMILSIDADNVTLANLTFTNGFTNYSGFQEKNLYSGAVQATGNNMIIENCQFISNQGFLSGAIDLSGDKDIIKECTFENNRVTMENNGIRYTKFQRDSSGVRHDVTYGYENTAGAIRWESTNGLLENCGFTGNDGCTDYIFVGQNNVVNLNKIKLDVQDISKYK